MDVLVVIPAYNEASTIAEVITGTCNAGYKNIIVIDDGSSDATREIALKAGAKVYSHPINCGVGAATMTGLSTPEADASDIVVTLDADGQHYGDDIEKIIRPIQHEQADMIIGSRFSGENSIPLVRMIFNKIANVISFGLSSVWLTDSQSGMRAFSRRARTLIQTQTLRFNFLTELNREASYHNLIIREVPIRVSYSTYSLKKGQNFATGIETLSKLILQSLFRP